MYIKKLVLGELEENCYILIKDKNCLIVDPGDEFYKIDNYISKNKLKVLRILITHRHSDHIGALNDCIDKYKCEIIDYNSKSINIIKDFKFKIIKTEGHTDDSITFYFENEKVMFVGDFIFLNSIGRTDLISGNIYKMKESIKKISEYDNDIIIYPGHGLKTTLGHEKKNNPFFVDGDLLC